MAHVRSAILCDFAQIREGLLFISSGGITRIATPNPPSPIAFHVGGHIEVPAIEHGNTLEVSFKVTSADTARDLWHATMVITTAADTSSLFPGESTHLPFALAVGPFVPEVLGPHDLKVKIDNQESELLTFYILQVTNPENFGES